MLRFSDKPVRALPCALSCFCLGSSWASDLWFLLLDRVGLAFIERRLSLLIIFYEIKSTSYLKKTKHKEIYMLFISMKVGDCTHTLY
jgi:hypothetical protein